MKLKAAVVSCILTFVISVFLLMKSKESHQLFEQNVEALTECEVTGLIHGSFIVEFDSVCNWTCRAGGNSSCPN